MNEPFNPKDFDRHKFLADMLLAGTDAEGFSVDDVKSQNTAFMLLCRTLVLQDGFGGQIPVNTDSILTVPSLSALSSEMLCYSFLVLGTTVGWEAFCAIFQECILGFPAALTARQPVTRNTFTNLHLIICTLLELFDKDKIMMAWRQLPESNLYEIVF